MPVEEAVARRLVFVEPAGCRVAWEPALRRAARGARPPLDGRGALRIARAKRAQAVRQPPRVQQRDREGAEAALGATHAAGEPMAGAAGTGRERAVDVAQQALVAPRLPLRSRSIPVTHSHTIHSPKPRHRFPSDSGVRVPPRPRDRELPLDLLALGCRHGDFLQRRLPAGAGPPKLRNPDFATRSRPTAAATPPTTRAMTRPVAREARYDSAVPRGDVLGLDATPCRSAHDQDGFAGGQTRVSRLHAVDHLRVLPARDGVPEVVGRVRDPNAPVRKVDEERGSLPFLRLPGFRGLPGALAQLTLLAHAGHEVAEHGRL